MRKLALLAVTAIAALAMTAATANAATVVKNANGVLCPPVVPAIDHSTDQKALMAYINPATYQSGGCTVRMISTGSTTIRPYQTVCNIDYTLHIGPDGWGYATQFKYRNCTNPYTASGTRVVGPVESNPYGWFTSANANTDFNTRWMALNGSGATGAVGDLSLDVTSSSTMTITNQRLTGEISQGAWAGLDPKLIITH